MSRGQSSADIVDLEAAARAVARLVEPTAREHGVRIDVGPLPPGLHVRADESELQHALINLVLNAVQACQPGGHVVLTAERNQLLRLRVTDDGCGILPEQRKRIFEPFVSLRKGGIGLGLFLSLNFVRRWGGDIVIESEPGRGSTFEIRLPAAASGLEGGRAS
jgi:signal transduction histidine kinase